MNSQQPPVRWHAIDVHARSAASEAIESAFNELDSLGTEINNLRPESAEFVTVTAYFHEVPGEAVVREAIDEHLGFYGLGSDAVLGISVREVIDEDWLAEWKRHWRPTEIGRFIIAPPWFDIDAPDKIVITIEPNMAFGTGTHETTKLCLDSISRSYLPDDSFLDVGSGTGILAIAAAKLSGTADIAAYETDADSVTIARENAQANGVGGRIEFFHGTISDDTPAAEFVCANITLDVLTPLLRLLISRTRRLLVLSGILTQQRTLIESELTKHGISAYEIHRDGEWIAVTISVV